MILDGGLILQSLAGGGTSGGKVKPITITENGTYNVSDAEKAEGYVGFEPVMVDVPDRYQDGYDKGHDDGVKSVVISPLTVTANGTYSAADYSCNGFDPVNVNVPDRYQEGYEDGQEHGKYTFPDGTSYSDVVNIVGGDAITDETLGVQVRTTETYGEDMYYTQTIVYDLSGNPLSTLRSWGFANSFLPTWGMPKVTYFSVTDSTTGAWKIIYTWDSGGTSEFTGTDTYLIGFGSDGHKYSASN